MAPNSYFFWFDIVGVEYDLNNTMQSTVLYHAGKSKRPNTEWTSTIMKRHIYEYNMENQPSSEMHLAMEVWKR